MYRNLFAFQGHLLANKVRFTEKLHPNLCSICQNSTLCSANDEFAGDDGPLRCLFSGFGQVAFTSSRTVERYLASDRFDRRQLNNFAYLCLDGSKLPLDSRACEWAHKPTNVFVTGPSSSFVRKDNYLKLLQAIFQHYVPYKPSWWRMRSLFSHPTLVTQILAVPSHLQRWEKYLGNYISSIEKPLPGCESNNLTLCTTSHAEELKCLDLQKAAFSQRVRPEIDCKRRASKQDCLEMVAKRKADLVAVDLSSLYEAPASVLQQLEPIGLAQGLADYSIALVRADSGIKFMYQLGGRRSCHASFGDTASWLAPLGVLTERNLLDQQACNKADQMADFFGASCVPGAADLRVNQYRSGSERLCALCKGDQATGQHQCERSKSERYFGQTGALRCLVEGAGEVAFMSLSSLAANVDGRSAELWARKLALALDSRNFRLVCRTGPSMALNDYERCNLASLPGKVLVSNKFATHEDRLTIRQLLVCLGDKFAREQREMFQLFAPYQNESDLLFDDNTNRLVPLQLESSSLEMLTKRHLDTSYQQLPLMNAKSQSCKLVLASSAPAQATPTLLLLVVVACQLVTQLGSLGPARALSLPSM